MISLFTRPRRALHAAITAATITVLVALMSLGSTAHADPYPPTGPSSTASSDPLSSVAPAHITTGGASHGLAYTGFAAITATLLAVVLLGGGILLVTLGRRRNGAPKR